MTVTTNLGVTLVEQSQAQKEITINEAFTRLDSILNNGAKSKTTNTPPGSPTSGDLYIVGTSPTGAWSGKAGQLSYYDQIWRFIAPKEGVSLWVNDEDVFYNYNGSSWVTPSGAGTVTSVAVTTANGVSGSVANATSSAAISLTLGAITPSSVAATGSVTGSNLSGTNTGDQTITLTGDITGSGTGSFATTIGAGKVTNNMLAGSIDLTSKVTGALPIANGGTGQTSETNAINALLPTQTGNSGKVLSTNGTSTSWISASGSGTVTSVGVSGSNGIGVSGSPITASGTIALSLGTITPTSVNGLTLSALTAGFTIAGGTTSKTLTVPLDASVSGTNTGDQTITLTGDITGTGTGSFVTTIGSSKVTNSMLAGSIDLTSKVTGALPIANGGTGQTSAANAINALLPTQTSNSGKVLSTNGTSASWVTANAGTVTSVAVSGSNGIGVSGSPVTSSGTISLSLGTITPTSVNGLTLAAQTTGFTIAGGTASKTLTVGLDANVSGTNTGDQTITLTGDITGSGTGSFATTIGASKVTNSMLAGSIDLTTKVTGALPIANGGTGQTSATNAINALLPTQTGNSGKVLSTNGTSTSWIAASGSGTVTSVAVSGSNGIGVSGSPVTASGTIALTLGAITPTSVNDLTLAAQTTGFTIAGGTTSKTLTVPLDATVSGTNTGDQTITLTGDITGTGTGSFVTTIGAGKVTNSMLAGNIDITSKVTGILPAANGGTANGYTAFSGPVSSTKTFALPNSSDSIACLGQVNAFTKQQYFSQSTLTDGASISWNLDSNQAAIVTLGGNRTLSNPTNLQAGASYTLIVKQDGTGSRTLSYGTAYKWPAGTAPVLSTAAASVDILTFISDGTNMFGVAQKGFA